MNLSKVATDPGGLARPATRSWQVTTPVARGYQTAFYLRFDTQLTGDGLEVDEARCSFTATFRPFDYNALSAPPIPPAALSMSKDGKAVIVKLDGPREVLSVVLDPLRPVEFHRADGRVQADKAAEFPGFTDVNFGVQPTDAIDVNQVKEVNVRGNPGNPRMGIAAPSLNSPVMFWPTPDTAGQMKLRAGAEMAKVLQAYLSAQWSQALKDHQQTPPVPLPQYIDAAVVIQSDAPCLLSISQFNVAFHYLLSSFSTGSDKQVLRYASKKVERQSVSIQLPATAVVASGTLRINESFHSGGASVTGDDVLDSGPIVQDRGIRISAGGVQSGGQRVTPSGAATAAGIALGLFALSSGAQLAIELQADQNGSPSGKKLAEASVKLESAGQPHWAVASFKAPVTLPGAPFWILVSAAKGSALWLAEAGGDSARLFDNIRGALTESARLDGLQALNRVLPPAPAAVQPGGQSSASLAHLSIGGAAAASGALQDDGSRLFHLAPQVSAFLAAARAGSPQAGTTAIPLVFTTGASGVITVYPPHIVYDVK
jgi:hypothetical protein